MPPIRVSARAGAPEETDADTRVIGLFDGDSLDEPALQALVDSGEASSKSGKVAVAHEGGKRVLIVGLGKRDELDAEGARVAASGAAARARELGSKSLSWALPANVAGALVEGTLLRLYRFDRFKSKDDDNGGVESLEIAGDAGERTRARADRDA